MNLSLINIFFKQELLKKGNELYSQLKRPGSRFPVCQGAVTDEDFLFMMILEQLPLKHQSKS